MRRGGAGPAEGTPRVWVSETWGPVCALRCLSLWVSPTRGLRFLLILSKRATPRWDRRTTPPPPTEGRAPDLQTASGAASRAFGVSCGTPSLGRHVGGGPSATRGCGLHASNPVPCPAPSHVTPGAPPEGSDSQPQAGGCCRGFPWAPCTSGQSRARPWASPMLPCFWLQLPQPWSLLLGGSFWA